MSTGWSTSRLIVLIALLFFATAPPPAAATHSVQCTTQTVFEIISGDGPESHCDGGDAVIEDAEQLVQEVDNLLCLAQPTETHCVPTGVVNDVIACIFQDEPSSSFAECPVPTPGECPVGEVGVPPVCEPVPPPPTFCSPPSSVGINGNCVPTCNPPSSIGAAGTCVPFPPPVGPPVPCSVGLPPTSVGANGICVPLVDTDHDEANLLWPVEWALGYPAGDQFNIGSMNPGGQINYVPSLLSLGLPPANCPTAALGVPGVDTDGDGAPDATDTDDDCDRLADTLETTLGTSRTDMNSDNDQTADGFDLAPTLPDGLSLTISITGITGLGGMDFCPNPCNIGDPYLKPIEVNLYPNAAQPFAVGEIPGLNEANHPRDKGPVTVSDMSVAGQAGNAVTVTLPDDISLYFRDSANDYPMPNLEFSLWDEDNKIDNEIDIDNAAGIAVVALLTFNLFQIATGTGLFTLNGESDDEAIGPNAILNVDVETNASCKAVSAASQVSTSSGVISTVAC